MNLKTFTLCLFILFLISCDNEEKYTPNGLTKLTETELIERALNKNITDFNKIVY